MSVDIHRNSACGPAVAPIQHTKKFFKISSVPLASVSPKSFNRDMRKAIVIVLLENYATGIMIDNYVGMEGRDLDMNSGCQRTSLTGEFILLCR